MENGVNLAMKMSSFFQASLDMKAGLSKSVLEAQQNNK